MGDTGPIEMTSIIIELASFVVVVGRDVGLVSFDAFLPWDLALLWYSGGGEPSELGVPICIVNPYGSYP